MSSPNKLVLPPPRAGKFATSTAALTRLRERLTGKGRLLIHALAIYSILSEIADDYRSTEFVTTMRSISRWCRLSEKLVERALAGMAQAGVIDYARLKRGPIAIRLLDVRKDRT